MKKIRDQLNLLRLSLSKFFDINYYKLENPDVKGNYLKHYYYIGYKEGRNPSKYFDNDYYLSKYKDVKDAGVNPLVHYLKKGKKEKRKIKGFTGININRLYFRLYDEAYEIKIHLVNYNRNINFIFNRIDSKNFDLINKLTKKYSVDRLIYFSGDDEILRILNKNVKCEQIRREYYLDIGLNDLNVCFDRQSLLAFNNNIYVNNLYFFINRLEDYDSELINYLAYYVKINRLKILSLQNVKICVPVFKKLKIYNDEMVEKGFNFIFKNNFILGLEIINDYVLKNDVSKFSKLFYESCEFRYTIRLDKEINIFYNKNNKDLRNVIFENKGIFFEDGTEIINFNSDMYFDIYRLEQVLKSNE